LTRGLNIDCLTMFILAVFHRNKSDSTILKRREQGKIFLRDFLLILVLLLTCIYKIYR